MAARTALRLPLKAPASSCFHQTCPRARIQPQWPARLVKTTPRRTTARTFATATLLKEKKYTEDHEWIELSEDGKTGTIGVSVYAAKSLGDVVYVELPTPNLEVNAGDSIGAVESVKSAADINTPVSGKIVAANDVLQEKPGTINKGPEAEGWIARIEVGEKGAGEVEGLMGKEAYDAFTAEE